MKFNKWTLGLAAVGVVSLASAARAEEKINAVQSALSSTTISGYVNVSAWWNLGTAGGDHSTAEYPAIPYSAGKQDGFNLDVVKLSIERPLDEADWAAGYKADLLFGPDANGLRTVAGGAPTDHPGRDFAIQQAYVALRVPVGNGIDTKFGVFNSIIGYESFDAGNNPNYTRSYGFGMEPTTHTGLLLTYRFNDWFSAAAGVANTYGPTINDKAHFSSSYDKPESYKTYMGSIALTAPDSMGFLAGATLYGGVINGYDSISSDELDSDKSRHSFYIGATLPTPVTGLKLGMAYDYTGKNPSSDGGEGPTGYWANSIAGYASYQITEKLAAHLRGEYVWTSEDYPWADYMYSGPVWAEVGQVYPDSVIAVTATVDYDLWKNVISRLEFRWDHLAGGDYGYSSRADDESRENAFLIAANVIYKF